jgi:uncharacterized membrane protein YbhN (UPF0104 family)
MHHKLLCGWNWISERMKQKPIRRGFYILVIIISLGFIVYSAYTNWSELKAQKWELDYKYILMSILLFPIGFLPVVAGWHRLVDGLGVKLPFLRNLRVYAISSLPRHIPGLVWYVSSRSLLYQEEGLAAGMVIAATAAEVFLHASTGFLMSILVFLRNTGILEQYQGLRWIVPTALLFLVAVIASSSLVKGFSNWLVKRWKYDQLPAIRRGSLVACLIWLFIAWCGGGFLLFLLVRGLVPLSWSNLPYIIGSWALASAIGLTIGIGVSGMGLREVTLATLLSLVIPPVTAIVAAIAFRLVFLVGEFIWVLVFVWATKSVPQQIKGRMDE